MFKTKEEIGEMAETFSKQMRGEDYSDVSNNVNLELMKKSYVEGYTQAQQDIMKELQEKDKEVKELEEKYKAERNDVLYVDKRVLEEKGKYQEVVIAYFNSYGIAISN